MTSKFSSPDFSTLLTLDSALALLTQLTDLQSHSLTDSSKADKALNTTASTNTQSKLCLKQAQQQWQRIHSHYEQRAISATTGSDKAQYDYEHAITDWLISLFNALFFEQNVRLVRGKHDPEYFPAQDDKPARIEFAHGFFSSALHELSHWCIAGMKRRQLPDFGYWYAPDGRTATQQQAFEQMEIRPQALECLFTLACRRPFQVSQDNLFADFDTSSSTFGADVYEQASHYINAPQTLPRDAKTLLRALLTIHNDLS